MKNIQVRTAFIFVIVCLMLPQAAQAATYYVANDGNDSRYKSEAQNIATPWKTINYGASQLAPGDILEVRTGIYRERVGIKVNGTADAPIIIKAYSQERPILDGQQIIGNWTKCASQQECLDNPNWQNIYYAKTKVNPLEKPFLENDEYLPISQEPNQSDPALERVDEFAGLVDEGCNFGHQIIGIVANAAGSGSFIIADPDGFYATLFKSGEKIIVGIKSGTNLNNGEYTLVKDAVNLAGRTTLTVDREVFNSAYDNIKVENQRFFVDSDKLTQADHYWNGSRIRFWTHAANNVVVTKYVREFIQARHMVIFDIPLKWALSPGGTKPDAYAFQNHPLILDKPGEYYYTPQPDADGSYKVYLWPRNAADLGDKIGISVLSCGININTKFGSYVTVDGFTIKGYSGPEGSTGTGGIVSAYGVVHDGFCAKNNLIYNIKGYAGICLLSGTLDVVENNTVSNVLDGFGIIMSDTKGKAIRNTVSKTQRTCIYATLKKGLFMNNFVGVGSTHANGISVYAGNEDILVAGNRFIGSTFTLQNCRNITVYNNILDPKAGAGYVIADWSQNGENVKIFNNIVMGSGNHCALLLSPFTTAKNNIIDGGSAAERSYNIYIGRSWSQNLRYGWSLHEGEIVADGTGEYGPIYTLNDVFEDVATYKLKTGGLATDRGIDITTELPEYLKDPFFAEFDFYKDIAGNPRSAWSAWDIGPYENNVSEGNRPPVLTYIGNKQVNEGTTLIFNIFASDPDNNHLIYSAFNLPAGATFDSTQQVFQWVPSSGQKGVYPGIRFEVNDGFATDSEEISVTVVGIASAPSWLTATAVSPSQIKLAWTDNSNDESTFNIERSISLAGPFASIASVGTNVSSYTNSGLASNMSYFYRVRAYNSAGYSKYSNIATAMTPNSILPAAPTNLNAQVVSYSQVALSWRDNANNEVGFKIERSTSASGAFSQIANVGTNVSSYVDTGLTDNTGYYYRVRAYNSAGDSGYSNTVAVTIPPKPHGVDCAHGACSGNSFP